MSEAPQVRTAGDRLLRRLFALYLSVIALITVGFGWHNVRAANDWAIGEWLINYSAGFVRRGLFGEIVLRLAHLAHTPIFLTVLALQVLLYWSFFAFVLLLTRGLRWSLPLAAILFSPATLAFHILDPPAAFRKEDILFAGMALLVWLLVFRRPRPGMLVLLLIALTQFAVLSHEPLMLYLPYVFGAVFVATPRARRAATLCAVPAGLAVATALTVSHYPGTAETPRIICSSIGSTLLGPNAGVCGGAILYLSRNLDYARKDVVRVIASYHYFTLYPLTLLLTAGPFALLFWRLRRSGFSASRGRALRIVYVTTAVAWIMSLPLFFVATDWGRWIYMHAVCLMLLVLLLLHSAEAEPVKAREEAAAVSQSPRRFAAALALLVYATCWTLPGVGLFPGRFGYLSLVRYLTNYSHLPHGTFNQ